MNRLSALLLASTLLAGGVVLPALAQTPPPASPPAVPTSPPVAEAVPKPKPVKVDAADAAKAQADAEASRQRSRAADRDAMFEAHLAALHAGLVLTPDQDKMWPPVEQAFRGLKTMRAELQAQRMGHHDDQANADDNPIATLKAVSQAMLDRGQALKALSDSAAPLYDSLTPDQRHRLPMLMRDLSPRSGPVAAMIDGLEEQDGSDRRADRGWRHDRGDRDLWGWDDRRHAMDDHSSHRRDHWARAGGDDADWTGQSEHPRDDHRGRGMDDSGFAGDRGAD